MSKTSWNCLLTFCMLLLVSLVVALPVTKVKPEKEKDDSSTNEPKNVEITLEYERYLKEVVEALESDPDFRKKLDKAPEADIRSGKIAQELDYVNHHVRTKLDEIKRREVERLRDLANKEYELTNDIDRDHMKVAKHLDHANAHTFEIEDLRKLILKTSEDLAVADVERRKEFKEYEMQKEFELQNKMHEMNEEQRKQFEQQIKEQKEKHNQHPKLHHPANKAQLEEVWENQDHMDKEDFNPHTFFALHDVDGNGFWDENEVKALFVKELDKVYQAGLPEDDMRERAEEMERMREHVFRETDTNHDGLISFQEFLDQTKREEFNKDPSWETVEEQPQYTHEEYLEFERRRQEEIQRMIAQGLLPPHPNMPHGAYPDGTQYAYPAGQHPAAYQQPPPMHYQQPQQQYVQQQQQYQQQQQQYQQQQPVYQEHQVHLNPNQVYQHVPQQAPQQQQQQQVPQQQQQQQQVPQQQQQQQVPQQQQQQVPQQQQQQQVPQQQQQQQQVPQQQQQQQQVPQQQQQVPQQQQQQQAPQNQQIPQQQQQQQVPQQQNNIPPKH